METLVFDLICEDFNQLSNGQILNVAVDRRIALQCFFQGTLVPKPSLFRFPDRPEKSEMFFERIDFRDQRFVDAIEDFVITTCRDIVDIAPSRGITTAVNQIFGKGALEVIAHGRMEVPDENAAPKARGADNSNARFGNVLLLPGVQIRLGS